MKTLEIRSGPAWAWEAVDEALFRACAIPTQETSPAVRLDLRRAITALSHYANYRDYLDDRRKSGDAPYKSAGSDEVRELFEPRYDVTIHGAYGPLLRIVRDLPCDIAEAVAQMYRQDYPADFVSIVQHEGD